MAVTAIKATLSGLPRRLVADGLIEEATILEAADAAKKEGASLVSYLVGKQQLAARDVAIAAAEEFGVPLIDLLGVDLLGIPMDLVDARLVRKHRALPLFRRGNRLFVAVSDPTNDRALDEIRFNTDLTVSAVLAEDDKLASAINKALQAQDTTLSDLADAELADGDADAGEADESGEAPTLAEGAGNEAQARLTAQTIHGVTEDIEAMRFNTAIAKLIELNNSVTKLDATPRAVAEPMVLMAQTELMVRQAQLELPAQQVLTEPMVLTE